MTSGNTLLQQAVRSIGGEKEFQRKTQLYNTSLRYVEANKDELLKKYAERWIAVYDARIVAHNKSLKALMQQVDKDALDVKEALIEYVSNKKQITLF